MKKAVRSRIQKEREREARLSYIQPARVKRRRQKDRRAEQERAEDPCNCPTTVYCHRRCLLLCFYPAAIECNPPYSAGFSFHRFAPPVAALGPRRIGPFTALRPSVPHGDDPHIHSWPCRPFVVGPSRTKLSVESCTYARRCGQQLISLDQVGKTKAVVVIARSALTRGAVS